MPKSYLRHRHNRFKHEAAEETPEDILLINEEEDLEEGEDFFGEDVGLERLEDFNAEDAEALEIEDSLEDAEDEGETTDIVIDAEDEDSSKDADEDFSMDINLDTDVDTDVDAENAPQAEADEGLEIIINDNPDVAVESGEESENENSDNEDEKIAEARLRRSKMIKRKANLAQMLKANKRAKALAHLRSIAKRKVHSDLLELEDELNNELKDEINDNNLDLPEIDTVEHLDVIEKGANEGVNSQNVAIEINNPESVVIAPDELHTDDLPEELSETLTLEDVLTNPNVTYNLAHLLTKAEYSDSVELVASSLDENKTPSYYLMVKQTPVAVAEFKNASEEIQAMFSDRDTYMRALQVVLSSSESQETIAHLKNFGIRPIIVPVIKEQAALKSKIVAATRALEKAYKEKEAQMFNNFRESFTTAAVMYCKNLQEHSSLEHKKSLISKALLTDTLKTANIANASVLVEEAFKKGILNDYAVIVEEALSLYSKTPEARHEVKNFVIKASYKDEASLDSNQAEEIE